MDVHPASRRRQARAFRVEWRPSDVAGYRDLRPAETGLFSCPCYFPMRVRAHRPEGARRSARGSGGRLARDCDTLIGRRQCGQMEAWLRSLLMEPSPISADSAAFGLRLPSDGHAGRCRGAPTRSGGDFSLVGLEPRSDWLVRGDVHAQSILQNPHYALPQLLVFNCENRVGNSARTPRRINRNLVAHDCYFGDPRAAKIVWPLARSVKVVRPRRRLADDVANALALRLQRHRAVRSAVNRRRNRVASSSPGACINPLTGSEHQDAIRVCATCRFDIVPTGEKGYYGLISSLGLQNTGP
jgi:hypothetical protein